VTPETGAGKLIDNASVRQLNLGGWPVSIVRVGLAETKNFAEGYEAIFGKKDDKKKSEAEAAAESAKKEEPKEEKK
jgi:hypothetical protein